MTFSDLGLSEPLVRAVAGLGYNSPTPIQEQAIPAVLAGTDLLAAAQTGTGKTAGFVLPILERLSSATSNADGVARPPTEAPAGNDRSASGPRSGPRRTLSRQPIRALILAPTRELAAQVEESVRQYGKHLPLKSMAMFGGVNINPQIERLRGRVDVLVATPGRLLDHVSQRTVDLSRVEILVLDEADRMLDMGFIHDIRRVLSLLPKERQNLLFSATFSDEIRELANGLLVKPRSIEVARRNAPAEAVDQTVILVDRDAKRELLAHLIRERAWFQVLVFTRTKHGANRLAEYLDKAGISALAIHGNKSQGARTRALAEFKDGSLQVLVATDIAARGIDIDELPHVVNYELPNVAEDYVHRIGRTGRAGASGQAVSLVCVDEHNFLRGIEKLIGRALPRQTVAGFEPDLSVRPEPIPMGGGRRDAAPRRAQRPPQGGGRSDKAPSPARPQGAKPAQSRPGHAPSGRPGSAPAGRGFGHTQSPGRRPGARGR
jgi:ATP-dependent RNA helicase RhlE